MYVCSANFMTCAKRWAKERDEHEICKESGGHREQDQTSCHGRDGQEPFIQEFNVGCSLVPNGGSSRINAGGSLIFNQMGVNSGLFSDLCLPYPNGSFTAGYSLK